MQQENIETVFDDATKSETNEYFRFMNSCMVEFMKEKELRQLSGDRGVNGMRVEKTHPIAKGEVCR